MYDIARLCVMQGGLGYGGMVMRLCLLSKPVSNYCCRHRQRVNVLSNPDWLLFGNEGLLSSFSLTSPRSQNLDFRNHYVGNFLRRVSSCF